MIYELRGHLAVSEGESKHLAEMVQEGGVQKEVILQHNEKTGGFNDVRSNIDSIRAQRHWA